jgi:hypothetical protein
MPIVCSSFLSFFSLSQISLGDCSELFRVIVDFFFVLMMCDKWIVEREVRLQLRILRLRLSVDCQLQWTWDRLLWEWTELFVFDWDSEWSLWIVSTFWFRVLLKHIDLTNRETQLLVLGECPCSSHQRKLTMFDYPTFQPNKKRKNKSKLWTLQNADKSECWVSLRVCFFYYQSVGW